MRSALKLSPPTVSLAYRLLMAAALPRLATRRDRSSRALASALRTTAMGQSPPKEREWIARIDARHAALTSGPIAGEERVSAGNAAASPTSGESTDVSSTVQWLSIYPVWGRFLMRFVRELAPLACLELGTGFGISTAYQAAALELNGAGTVYTLDCDAEWVAIAEEGLSRLGLSERVKVQLGEIDETLGSVLEQVAPIDYAFLDADKPATLSHFATLLPHLSSEAVVVIDDINAWDMGDTWTRIASHELVSTAVALRRVGIAVIVTR